VAKEHEQKNKSQQPNTTGSSVAEENPDWEANNEFITIYAEQDKSIKTNVECEETRRHLDMLIHADWFISVELFRQKPPISVL
jgi:hypothetical protein